MTLVDSGTVLSAGGLVVVEPVNWCLWKEAVLAGAVLPSDVAVSSAAASQTLSNYPYSTLTIHLYPPNALEIPPFVQRLHKLLLICQTSCRVKVSRPMVQNVVLAPLLYR